MKIYIYTATVFDAIDYLQTGKTPSHYGYGFTAPQDNTWRFPLDKEPEKEIVTFEEFYKIIHNFGVDYCEKIPALTICAAAMELELERVSSSMQCNKKLLIKLNLESNTIDFDKIGFSKII